MKTLNQVIAAVWVIAAIVFTIAAIAFIVHQTQIGNINWKN